MLALLLINLFGASAAFALTISYGWGFALLATIVAGAAAVCLAAGWRGYIVPHYFATAGHRGKTLIATKNKNARLTRELRTVPFDGQLR